jgi:two-component system chemotaxis response regulator CheY
MKKILYLEDEEELREMVESFLNRKGYQVNSYPNPVEFIGNKDKDVSSYNLVLTDINMPYMTGIKFVKDYIVDKGIKIPVIFNSGVDSTEDIKKAGIMNFSILLKPTQPSELENKIKEIFNKIE